jgi:hypothetical protein
MKLTIPEKSYFVELGEIVSIVEKINSLGLMVEFSEHGIRISESYGKAFKDPYYQTASELRAYFNGLEDGFWHAIRVNKNLFTDSKFTDPK